MSFADRMNDSFDPDFATPADWARMYRACGLQVVPGRPPDAHKSWKVPLLGWTGFQEELVPDFTFERWYGEGGKYKSHGNMGLIMGRCSRNVLTLDLDIYKHKGAAEWWQGLLVLNTMGIEPTTCEQRTGGGGRQLLFQAPKGFEIPNSATDGGVDVRGQGGWVICPPSMHTSGQEYEWLPGRGPWECEIAEAPPWLLRAITELAGASAPRGPREHTASPTTGDINAFGGKVDGREEYMRDVVWAAVVDLAAECPIPPDPDTSEARLLNAYDAYRRNVRPRVPGQDADEALEREGRGLGAFREKWARAVGRWSDVLQAAQERPAKAAPEPSVDRTKQESRAIALRPAFPISTIEIPPRDWTIPGLLLRKHLSVLVAPPGSGKSLLTLQLAIAIAAGRAWGGWTIRKPAKVLVINAEDDLDEMRRRLFAAAERMGIDQSELAGRVLLADAPESIVIARADAKTKTVIRTPLLEQLVATIEENEIGVVIVDPFAETFEGDENSNSEIKWAGILWREVARRTGSSVLLVHHTKKYASGMAGDADASRGGGALIGTARILATLFAMTEEEAGTMGVEPERRHYYVRFDDAKANNSLITGQAKWFEKASVALNNGRGMIPGDEVGVLMPWAPPGLMEGVELATIWLVLDTIDRGLVDENGHPTGTYYTPSASSPERWAGRVVAKMLGCDEARAKKILNAWLAEPKVLDVFDYDDAKGRNRKGLRSVPENRPGRAIR